MKGGKGVFNVLTFQKSRGARAHLGGGGANAPLRPCKGTPGNGTHARGEYMGMEHSATAQHSLLATELKEDIYT